MNKLALIQRGFWPELLRCCFAFERLGLNGFWYLHDKCYNSKVEFRQAFKVTYG